MPNIHSSNESEDGSSSLEPLPSAPPPDDCNMGEDDKAHPQDEPHAPQHHSQPHAHALGGYTFAEAVTNGHAVKSSIDQTTKVISSHLSDLPPRAPQCSETTQPLLSASMHYNVDDSRADTPSGIMRDMSLNEHQHDETLQQGTLQCPPDGEIETSQGVDANHGMGDSNEPAISSEDATEIYTTTSQEVSGVGAVLSQFNSQQPQHHQQQGKQQTPEELTTYYSMASQCSLPIHTPTAVAPDNERVRKLSREFLKREDTFERLSFILGRGRLVMVRSVLGYLSYPWLFFVLKIPPSSNNLFIYRSISPKET